MHVTDLKLYIAVHDEVPDHMVPVLVAHTILNADKYLEKLFIYREWKQHSFKKVVLRVNEKEFLKIMDLEGVYAGYEKHTMGGDYSCAIVAPREEYPSVIKFAKMWSPKILEEDFNKLGRELRYANYKLKDRAHPSSEPRDPPEVLATLGFWPDCGCGECYAIHCLKSALDKINKLQHAVAERPGSELQPHQAQLDSESRVQ